MAFLLSTDAADGREIDGAYWVPAQINVGAADKTGNLTFYGYASKVAMDAGKAPIAGAVKSYSFTAQEFMAAQMTPMAALFPQGISGANIMYEVLARFAYGVALTRKDVPVLDESGAPILDENQKPKMRSFFEAAQKV